MPKVSEEHKERRREQILEGARRCFARHGYEGATVARLEKEIGLSRGAIFNYFPNKAALFVELAVETSRRVTDIWLKRASAPCSMRSCRRPGLARRPVRGHPPHSHRSGLPAARRGERARARGHPPREAGAPSAAGARRRAARDAAIFLSFVANGLALRQAMGDPLPDLDALAKLVDEGVAPR